MKQRNERGLSLLFERYSGSIMGLLIRMLNDRHIAEEVLQTTFLKAWERIDRYDENKASLHTWLYTIARNSALDVIRLKSFERRSKKEPMDKVNEKKEPVYVPTAGIDTNKLLNSIEDKYRKVLDCLYLQGYSQRETAELLDIPLGTVKSRLRVGMRNIRNEISSETALFWAISILVIFLLIIWSSGIL
ncbi:MAG: RNA polymerase sigma factor [Saprospiraceae bacterium]|nr:RNA polymerase sigma factor [Saprospiraceae bacterium]